MTYSNRAPSSSNVIPFLARVLVPLLIGGSALIALVFFASGEDPREPSTLVTRILAGAGLSVAALLLVIHNLRTRGAQQSLSFDPRRGVIRGLSIGMLLWILPAALAFAGFAALGSPISITSSPSQFLSIVALVFAAVLLSEAIPEELVFRGYLMSVLSEKIHDWWTIVTQAALFTGLALALRGWTGVSDLSLFIGMGIGLGYMRAVSGSVWLTVGFHAMFQTGSQLLFTHDVLTFNGSLTIAMIALGAVPFALGAILTALLVPKYPQLFTK